MEWGIGEIGDDRGSNVGTFSLSLSLSLVFSFWTADSLSTEYLFMVIYSR